MTNTEVLKETLDRIEKSSPTQNVEAVKLIAVYLQRRNVQRLAEPEQFRQLEEAFQNRKRPEIYKFFASQYNSVRTQASMYVEELDALQRPLQPIIPEEVPCEQSN